MVWVELEGGVIFQKKHEQSKSTQTVEGHNPATLFKQRSPSPLSLNIGSPQLQRSHKKDRWGPPVEFQY